MTDFFREVDEEIRREQMKKLWDRFGPALIAVAVLVVVGTGGYRFWQWYEVRAAGTAGAAYYNAVRDVDASPQTVAAALGELASGGTGYRALARMRIAGAQAETGDIDAAVAGFDAVAADGSVDGLLRDMARVRAAYLLIDTADLAALKERVEEMTVPANTFRHSAREILGLAAFKAGEYVQAVQWFDAIMADAATPQGLRNRGELMQSLLTSRLPAEPASEGSGQ